MIEAFRNLFPRRTPQAAPQVPEGERVYAIGDIHGRSDLFQKMIEAIEWDNQGRDPARTTIILLGDLIDRGPESASVIAMAREWQRHRNVRIITGNHEEVFFASFFSLEAFTHFLQFGGRETILSYPVDPEAFAAAELEAAQAMMVAAVPREDLDFIAGFEDFIVMGDYLFVHAGIRPDRPLEEQLTKHLRWIREPFLSHRGDHGHFVVHGHTITAEPDLQPNRLGLDTGAYMSGQLTAIGLQGTDRWLVRISETAGGPVSTVDPIVAE